MTEIYASIDHLRPSDMNQTAWKQSFDGVSHAFKSVGLEMITTREEFKNIAIPIDTDGKRNYSLRKVIVSRNGIQNKQPTTIKDLLRGISGLLTNEEKTASKEKMIEKMNAIRQKGCPVNNIAESNAINEFNILLQLDQVFNYEHLIEHRLSDIAYKFINEKDESFVGIQVKTASINNNGDDNRLSFCHGESYMTCKNMKDIIDKTSILCLGTNQNKIDVVWFFHDNQALEMFKSFDGKKEFRPVPHPTKKSTSAFTNAYNAEHFRYDMNSKMDVERLKNTFVEVIKSAKKNTLEFYNEDDSQIPCDSHKVEHQSFVMTRAACNKIDVSVTRIHGDAYGPVDFRINDVIRIQDKVAGKMIRFRRPGGHPYDPDTIDAIQITNIETKTVYLLPMRHKKNEEIVSFFSEEHLMRHGLSYTDTWRNNHTDYKYDLNTKEGIERYVSACKAAHEIPKLTDQNFYKNLIEKNADSFGSKKKMANKA